MLLAPACSRWVHGACAAGLIEDIGVKLDPRRNIGSADYAAGDARRGQLLVVWAIAEGRKAADAVGRYLQQ